MCSTITQARINEWGREVLSRSGLVGAYLERANLKGKNLAGVNLTAANLRGADLSEANLRGATIIRTDLSRACLYKADLEGAILDGSDLSMSYAKCTSFKDASMRACALRGVTYKNSFFWGTDLRWSDFRGAWMLGTVFCDAKLEHVRNLQHALFYWYFDPDKGPAIFKPKPGYQKIGRAFPGVSYQENAGMGKARAR